MDQLPGGVWREDPTVRMIDFRGGDRQAGVSQTALAKSLCGHSALRIICGNKYYYQEEAK